MERYEQTPIKEEDTMSVKSLDTDDTHTVVTSVESVAESLSLVREICGVSVTAQFLDRLDVTLRQHLRTYELQMERSRELTSVKRRVNVQSFRERFDVEEGNCFGRVTIRTGASQPPPAPPAPPTNVKRSSSTTRPRSNSPQAAPAPTTPQVPPARQAAPAATAPPAAPSELTNLNSQGLVSTVSTAFRSRLERIVTSMATTNNTTSRSRVTRPQPPPQRRNTMLPPPPRVAATPPTQPRAYRSTGEEDIETQQELQVLALSQVTQRVLASQFRERLENVLRDRIVSSNIPPPRDLRVRPTTYNPQQQQALFPPQIQRYHGSFAHGLELEQRVDELTTELTSMKAMLRTSMQMQSEMQRMLAAHLNVAVPPPPTLEQEEEEASEQQQQQQQGRTATTAGMCVVCSASPAEMVFFSCGHQCSCASCCHRLKNSSHPCPICRAKIDNFVRAFPV